MVNTRHITGKINNKCTIMNSNFLTAKLKSNKYDLSITENRKSSGEI